MGANVKLKIESEEDALDIISAAVEDLSEREEWAPDLLFKINLVLEELGLNAIQYGAQSGTPDIEILIDSSREAVTITITDAGIPFDPLHDAPPPDLDASIEDRKIGRLGIYFVREIMDEAYYRREDGKNHLTLVKQRA